MTLLLLSRTRIGVQAVRPQLTKQPTYLRASKQYKTVAMAGGYAHQEVSSIARSTFQKSWLMALVIFACAAPSTAKAAQETNVLGGKLELCCTDPMTGFHRDGFCRVSAADGGVHAVCAQVTDEFLDFSASRGNNLRSVVQPGQKWCLCVSRWKEAKVAGKAPPVILASTSQDALQGLTLEELLEHAVDADKAQATQ